MNKCWLNCYSLSINVNKLKLIVAVTIFLPKTIRNILKECQEIKEEQCAQLRVQRQTALGV